jgi:hypothetical protein
VGEENRHASRLGGDLAAVTIDPIAPDSAAFVVAVHAAGGLVPGRRCSALDARGPEDWTGFKGAEARLRYRGCGDENHGDL